MGKLMFRGLVTNAQYFRANRNTLVRQKAVGSGGDTPGKGGRAEYDRMWKRDLGTGGDIQWKPTLAMPRERVRIAPRKVGWSDNNQMIERLTCAVVLGQGLEAPCHTCCSFICAGCWGNLEGPRWGGLGGGEQLMTNQCTYFNSWTNGTTWTSAVFENKSWRFFNIR